MLTQQRPARFGTQSASVLGGSAAAAALLTCWFIAILGPVGLIAFPLTLILIFPVAILPALLLYRLAARLQVANVWTAATAGLLTAETALFVGDLTLLFPAAMLWFGVAGIAGGIAFWRGVRNETDAPDPPDKFSTSPPAPS